MPDRIQIACGLLEWMFLLTEYRGSDRIKRMRALSEFINCRRNRCSPLWVCVYVRLFSCWCFLSLSVNPQDYHVRSLWIQIDLFCVREASLCSNCTCWSHQGLQNFEIANLCIVLAHQWWLAVLAELYDVRRNGTYWTEQSVSRLESKHLLCEYALSSWSNNNAQIPYGYAQTFDTLKVHRSLSTVSKAE